MSTTAIDVMDAALSLGKATPFSFDKAIDEFWPNLFGVNDDGTRAPGSLILPVVYHPVVGAQFAEPIMGADAVVLVDGTILVPLDELWQLVEAGAKIVSVVPYVQATAAYGAATSYDGEFRYSTSSWSYRAAARHVLHPGILPQLLPKNGGHDARRALGAASKVKRDRSEWAVRARYNPSPAIAASAVDQYLAKQIVEHDDDGIQLEGLYVVRFHEASNTWEILAWDGGKILGDGKGRYGREQRAIAGALKAEIDTAGSILDADRRDGDGGEAEGSFLEVLEELGTLRFGRFRRAPRHSDEVRTPGGTYTDWCQHIKPHYSSRRGLSPRQPTEDQAIERYVMSVEWRRLAGLTDREAAVMYLTYQGYDGKTGAQLLQIAPSTFRTLLGRARGKISASA